ncbi:hypothetical protein CH295_13265 [Rhodococcus sp. 14-2483-1-2]|nr:hypothetical protein CH295_13265 [Rhodococcus sp. 14-2483-1-2]
MTMKSSTTSSRIHRTPVWLAMTSCVIVGVVACSSGTSAESSGGETAAAGDDAAVSTEVVWTAAPAGYLEAGGVELPSSYPEPTGSPGENCKIGYITPTNAIPGIQKEIDGATGVATEFGCSMVVKDGQLSPQTQVTAVQSLLAEGVRAIIVNPVDPAALAAPIEQANGANVPVITVDAPPGPGDENLAGVTSTVLQSRDMAAFEMAAAVADAQPDGKVGMIYPAFQSKNLQYQVERFQYWGEELGLEFVAQEEVAAHSPESVSTATSALLQQNPQITAVMAYNDSAASAAAAVVRTLGRTDMVVTGVNGDSGTTGLIADGRILATWAFDNTSMGEQEGRAAINAANGVEIPEKVLSPGAVIDKNNVSSYEPQA